MSISITCSNCKQILEFSKAGNYKCPKCNNKILITENLLNLPSPKIKGNKEIEEEYYEEKEENRIFAILSTAMPWVISTFLHIGLFILALFIVFIVSASQPKPMDISIPDIGNFNEESPGTMNFSNTDSNNTNQQSSSIRSRNIGRCPREGSLLSGTGLSGSNGNIDLIGLGSGGSIGGGGTVDLGIGSGGPSGPKSNFIGNGTNSHHIVFVIDRSGSMINSFDNLRMEMFKSIGQLDKRQDFHVIMFCQGTPIEAPPKCLVYASRENKIMVADFLRNVSPENQTDVLPALKRAFEVLSQADKSKKGKIIYLLTDGLFPNNKQVIDLVNKENSDKEIAIFTYLYGNRDKEAENVLKKIAEENKGRYKFFQED